MADSTTDPRPSEKTRTVISVVKSTIVALDGRDNPVVVAESSTSAGLAHGLGDEAHLVTCLLI
eukprot:scaffold5679_cov58-Cylindrotheca_fusiformis.AAC.1